MKVRDPGHEYEVANLDGSSVQVIYFVKRFRGDENHEGTTCQELLRVLIDRVEFLHVEKPHFVNKVILRLLRRALVLFEVRALDRKVTKGELLPELVEVSAEDGHFAIVRTA